MSEKLKVTYKPTFDYDKSYSTIGNVDNTTNISDIDSASTENSLLLTKPIVFSNLMNLRLSNLNLPSEITPILNDMIYSIIDSLQYIKDTDLNNSNEDNVTFEEGESDNTVSENANTVKLKLPTSLVSNNRIYTIKNIDSKDYDIVDAFDYTMLVLYDEFISKIRDSVNAYDINILLGRSMGDVNDLAQEYDQNTLDVDRDLMHLSDNIIRSEVLYDQKTRLASKLFTYDNSINHFRAIYASKVFYERYKAELYQQGVNRKNTFINQSLKQTTDAYYAKYINNLTNIYKYYNSCAVIIGECMNTKAQIFVSKNIIN